MKVAIRRAAHQLMDDPKVFDDPLAVKIVGPKGAEELGREVERRRDVWSSALRAHMAMRSRFAEDCLARAYAAGVRQYVVLGAGLDTFAWRNPHPGLRVFEVDHPSTQAWKRKRLQQVEVPTPEGLVYAPVDFETQTLEQGLAAAGFDPGRPAFFSWLGVVMYLTEEAAFRTLAYVAGLPAGSEIVFDFPIRANLMSPLLRRGVARLAHRVAALGEPFRSDYDPAELEQRLRALGFSQAETLGPDALNRLYFAGRRDGLRLRGPARVARATV
jgi:methyltransferase (TIGR00027 family)